METWKLTFKELLFSEVQTKLFMHDFPSEPPYCCIHIPSYMVFGV